MTEPCPRVSVVLADAPDGDTLRRTALGVLAQTEPDTELLIVDDGTLDVVGELEAIDDPRMVLVPAPGVARLARLNLGIALAHGRFLLILSPSTTELEPSYVERRADALDAEADCDVAVAVSDGGDGVAAHDAPPLRSSGAALLLDALAGHVLPPAAALVRTSALREIGGFDATLTIAHDADLWLRLLPGRRIIFLHAPPARVRLASSEIPRDEHESVRSRSERAYVIVLAVREQGIDWWGRAARDARGDGDAHAAWIELCVRLLRTRLPEVAPLLRAARRSALGEGFSLPSDAQLELRAREPGSSFQPWPCATELVGEPSIATAASRDELLADLPGAAAIHDLARLASRTERTVRDLRRRAADLEADSAALGSELALARSATTEAIELGARAFEKLRLARRLKALSQRVAERARTALVKPKPPSAG